MPRSKSSDILKKDSPTTCALDNTSKHTTKLSHFNSLKQWGRNRLRMINRDSKDKVHDIDDFNISDTTKNTKRKVSDKDIKLSHDRKPSYSSSERSITVASSTGATTSMPASINPVKLRESSSIRRQRRTALGNKDEPHSSSGNWSASSESGRTSIGSEITTTTHPKSSASSTSLNHNHHTISSGPPSSIISRRRFLNTSASSSVTSEGTATPDLQMYDYHDEGGETSSVYSCDTEGYYTSFHVDSGLKTLKEEEPVTPMHSTTALSSTTSFESSGNQTVISPENEYELFGRGSTSTTTSSAGTICTVLVDGHRNSLIGPTVPERKSSLTKLNRSNSSASNGTLERSYSSSTVGSTLERTGTIKRNGHLLQKEVAALIHKEEDTKKSRIESPDSGNNTSSSPIESNANSSPTQRIRSCSEFEYSESSDLECVDRIERIREKTTINTSRIPSMCIITPTNSDDESGSLKQRKDKTGETVQTEVLETKKDSSSGKKNALQPLNSMFGRLKGVLKKSPSKESSMSENVNNVEPVYDVTGEYVRIAEVKTTKKIQHSGGVYYSNDVVKRNLATVLSGNLNEETEYVSLNELPCNMRCESNVLSQNDTPPGGSGKLNTSGTGGEAPSAGENNEHAIKRGARVKLDAHGKVIYSSDSLKRRKGAHTTFAPGPFVKDVNTAQPLTTNTPTTNTTTRSASPAASTENGKCAVVASPLLSGGLANRKPIAVKPVISQSALEAKAIVNTNSNISNHSDGVAAHRMAPIASILPNNSTVQEVEKIAAASHIMSSGVLKGAYVNVQESKPPSSKPQSIHYMEATNLQHPQTGKQAKSQKNNKIVGASPKARNVIFPSTRRYATQTPSPLSFKTQNSTSRNTHDTHHIRRNKDIDPDSNSTIKRRNSYRNANSFKIDTDAASFTDFLEEHVNKQEERLQSSAVKNDSNSYNKYTHLHDQNSDKDDGYEEISDIDLDEDSKSIARSFERLLNLSDEVFGLQKMDSTRPSILEKCNFDELDTSTVENNDDELEIVLRDLIPSTPTGCRRSFSIPLTPSKLTIPSDGGQHRARVLSFSATSNDNSTDIW